MGPGKTHERVPDFPVSGTDPPSPPVERKNQEPVYKGQTIMGHSGRKSPLIRSLAKGLKGNPLASITKLLPTDYTRGEGRAIPEMFVDKLVHHHFSV